MRHVEIRIQSKDEKDKTLFPELNGKKILETELNRVGILEGGMEKGTTSVSLITELPDGSFVFMQLSGAQFLQIAGAVRGAAMRFGDPVF